jgi:L-2-hydroxyglutarate oxidase LhgO
MSAPSLRCGWSRPHVVNCAGLWAQAVARRLEGIDAASIPGQKLAKGHYFALRTRSPFERLVYPVPGGGGLGVHVTLDMGGRAKFGPDVEWLDLDGPAGLDYTVDAARIPQFEAAIRRYWPGLPEGALVPDYTGVRPKLAQADGQALDFRIDGGAVHGAPGHVMLYGVESPGLTASLAIAEHVVARLDA